MEKLKILFVDDEKDLLNIMGMRMRSWGYDVFLAESGREGVEAAQRENPDIIITDYLMPDMDGPDTIKEIRKFNKRVPIIMFTAHPDKETTENVKELGIAALVPKFSVYSEAHESLREAIKIAEREIKKRG